MVVQFVTAKPYIVMGIEWERCCLVTFMYFALYLKEFSQAFHFIIVVQHLECIYTKCMV